MSCPFYAPMKLHEFQRLGFCAEVVSSPVKIINTLKNVNLTLNLNLSFFLIIFIKRFFLISKCCVILWLIIFTKYLDKNKYIFLNIYRYSNSKHTGAYFCLLIYINLSWVPDSNLTMVFGQYLLKAVNIM